MTCLDKQYDYIHPANLVDDPAQAAEDLGLVGEHTKEARITVGAWRWAGVHHYRDWILERTGGHVIDFGGAAGPLNYGAVVVDPAGPVASLSETEPADLFFTSHTLEHIEDLDWALEAIADYTKPGGHLFCHVPSYKREKWRADEWPYHYHTFCTTHDSGPDEWVRLDERLEPWFEIVEGVYASQSLVLIGRRKA